ncbi:MAG: T9SS type A sorting domain-containing protein [Ignavibacteriae bacterium]|nr:T9SS C-terminal target domain-containing protein [Ignavibacteriota bacterium]NOG98600.1 T9SS type A sorting domain-containing protein [Ignavibacteriota bacterium]
MTKFNENDLTFDSLLSYPLTTTENMKGFAIDDFDLDGKTDIIYSATMGSVYVLENEHSDNYSISWQGNIGISNAYLLFKTNDFDKNGKPEFWVGGEDLSEGFTKLVCFESLGNNSYFQAATIKLLGLASLNVSNGIGIDVDNDFNDELFVKVGNYCLIIKFTGSSNNHNYEVYYFYKADNVVQSADMVQFPYDYRPSIVMSMYESNNGNRRDFSHILRHQQTTDLKDENTKIINDYKIFRNYPNPFNPSTNVSFWLSQNSEVSIIVYNLLGEEVITLLSNPLNKGEYKIVWNGNDKYNQSVPSGVYFISLKARSTSTDSQIQKTLKSVLLK